MTIDDRDGRALQVAFLVRVRSVPPLLIFQLVSLRIFLILHT
jgi:hypothetical protein